MDEKKEIERLRSHNMSLVRMVKDLEERLRLEVDNDDRRLLTSREVCKRCSINIRTLYRMVERGDFPEPVRYNRKLVRWRMVDVERAINKREVSCEPLHGDGP